MKRKKNQPQLRLVISNDDSFAGASCAGDGYKSGRNSYRETPVRASTDSTRSAGTRPVEIQRETLPCDFSPNARANAVWPPMASHAFLTGDSGNSGSTDSETSDLDMTIFNAQFVNPVNAYRANELPHTSRMGREAEAEPSEFWKRLTMAWGEKNLPTTQNGVAKRLGMTGNGSTGRWYRGDGLPETETLMQIARLGGVTIDWLLTGNEPRSPVAPGSDLDALLKIWAALHPENRGVPVRAAEGELALQQRSDAAKPGKTRTGTG